MISRVNSIDRLFLDERIDIDKIKCNARALEENNSLNDRSIVKLIKEVKVDLFFVNIQSLKNNLNDLKNDIYAAKANFICLAETWLEENDTIEYEGWNFYHSSKGRGKGCCLFYREGIECDLIGHFATDSFSLLSAKINETTQLFIVYLSQAKNGVKEQLWRKIKEMRLEGYHMIMVGDFNIEARNSDLLTHYFIQNHLVQLVTEPTHIQGRMIDHLWVSKNFPKLEVSYQYPYYTQHKSILIEFK